ncbi:MAG TPA: hypothetical protein PKC30_03565 [Saprospiraceae bacterium]|nr:hypothetical protein [Saprospiraceae bacterium]
MDLLYKIYFSIPGFSRFGYLGKAGNRILELIYVYLYEAFLPKKIRTRLQSGEYGVYKGSKREEKYIVSLTSFPARMDRIWITIDSLLRQSFKPDRVILWLGNEQFPGWIVPDELKALQQRGLEIRMCDDLKSHKKYYYSCSQFKDANIITCDDDVYYPRNTLEELVNTHIKYPTSVVANFAHLIICREGRISPYKKWKHKYKSIKKPSHQLLQVGVGGVLYPPNSLYKDVFNKELIFQLSPKSDDVWLKTMSYLNGTKIITNQAFTRQFITVRGSQKESLVAMNTHKGLKDKQIENVLNHYSQIDISCLE